MRRHVLIALLLTMVISNASFALAQINIGILAKRGPDVVARRWTALATYLTKKTGVPVTFVPLKFTEVMRWCSKNPDQFIFVNSWFYIRAKFSCGAKALVTVQNQGTGTMFGGVIFTKESSPITHLQDIRGKTLMCPKFSSAGGWIFQKGVMLKVGIKPERDCKTLLEGHTHDAVVLAVRDGKADVGTVRTGILERMNREGKINIHEFRVLHKEFYDNFTELCSTPLYPSWPIASLKNTPLERSDMLKDALLSIPPGHHALNVSHVTRFVEALDYGPLEKLLWRLHVQPFR